MVNHDDNFDDYSTYFDDMQANTPMKSMEGARDAMMRFQGAFTPFMTRAPKGAMSPAAATFSNLAAAMMGLKEKKLRTSLQHFKKYEQSRNTALSEARRVADGYRNIMRKSYSNPYHMKTQLMQAARDYQDPLMINALQGSDPAAAYNRMTELSKLNDLVEGESGKLRDYYGKRVMGTRRMLKELVPEDLAIMDQINFDRQRRGEEPWTLEDYYYAKGVFKSPQQQEFPKEYELYQLAQHDPEFRQFYQDMKARPESMSNRMKEYQFAQGQGYKGSLMDFIKETMGKEGMSDFDTSGGVEQGQEDQTSQTQPAQTQKQDVGMGGGILRGMASMFPGGTELIDRFTSPQAPTPEGKSESLDDIFGSPEMPGNFTGFPTKHPLVRNPDGSVSGALLGGFEIDGRHYVIPTMVGGKRLTGEQAVDIARQYGLDKYPSFATEQEASAFAQKYHSRIDENGRIMPEGTGGMGAGMDMGSFIRQKVQEGADPVQLFAQMNREYERTGDENMNPSRYWKLFGFQNLSEEERKALMQNTGTIRLGPGVE